MLLGIFTMINERKRILLWNRNHSNENWLTLGHALATRVISSHKSMKIASWEPWKNYGEFLPSLSTKITDTHAAHKYIQNFKGWESIRKKNLKISLESKSRNRVEKHCSR